MRNPESGSIISEDVVSYNKVEFFLMAQNVTQGTCTPTNYTIFMN